MIMKYSSYIYSLILSMVLGFLYNRYKKSYDLDEEMSNYAMVNKFLVGNDDTIDNKDNGLSLAKSKKPILWIHMNYDINARWWSSFYSRNSTDLNQPYLYLTIKSIIDACGKDFNICIIDDESFDKLIPDFNINVSLFAEPIKSKMRELAFSKLLFRYGGVRIPPAFICFQSLLPLYRHFTDNGLMFVGESLNKTSISSEELYFPNTTFMGCLKECPMMLEYMTYLEKMISQDFVDESNFIGAYGRWCYEKASKNEIGIIKAEMLGIKDAEGTAITVDRLMQNTYVNLSGIIVGLYIPENDILKRTAYNWFARLSAKQVLDSETTIGKYLLITR